MRKRLKDKIVEKATPFLLTTYFKKINFFLDQNIAIPTMTSMEKASFSTDMVGRNFINTKAIHRSRESTKIF